VTRLHFGDLYDEDERRRATEQNRRAEECRRSDAEATTEAEGQALIAACGLCNERGLIPDETTGTRRRECDHPETSSGDAGASTNYDAADPGPDESDTPDPSSATVEMLAVELGAIEVTGTPEARPKDVDMVVGEIPTNEGAHK
jgi:hypothetical protein